MVRNATSTAPAPVEHPDATSTAGIDRAVAELQEGARRLVSSSLDDRLRLLEACIERTGSLYGRWIELGQQAKQTLGSGVGYAEEALGGPVCALRFLHLTAATLDELQRGREPRLPGSPREVHGQWRVPVFPTRQLFDSLIFMGLRAETWLQPGVGPGAMFGDAAARLRREVASPPHVELVLGAGNVSSIPVTDALTKIFHQDCAVLLKMNPVNDYLGGVLEGALAPVIQAGWLRVVYGGAEQGAYAVGHAGTDSVHITGSTQSHDVIVWGRDLEERRRRQQAGQPLLNKPITSELGNVTPWIIVPGKYSARQLRSQAEGVVAAICNNASFNCIAVKMLITWRHWEQRSEFLDLVESILRATPTRMAYYPGAIDRFRKFAGFEPSHQAQGHLPWILRRNVAIEEESVLFREESFVCVTGETSLDGDSPADFLDRAVAFANDQMNGTLAAGITVPDGFRRTQPERLDAALRRLRYGTVGVNVWPGVAFALMSTPWGGYPGATLIDVQSGIGSVHNTFLLDRTEKTVVYSPLCQFPKPIWFSTHRCPDQVTAALCHLYARPGVGRIPPLLWNALRG